MLEPTYFLQRCDKDRTWEEVDDYLFKNWKYAKDDSGNPRYNGNRIFRNGSNIQFIQETPLSSRDFVHIAKLGGATQNELSSGIPGGFCKQPDFVELTKSGNNLIRKVGVETYKTKPASQPVTKPNSSIAFPLPSTV
jgi:hypothetical protein